MLSLLLFRSSDARPIAWCLIGLCAGLYLFVKGFRLLQRRHLILDTPASKIRSAPLGLVELNGLAVGPFTITAPITARPCYFYRTIVSEWKQSGRNKSWVKVAAECMHVPFFLDDNTGRVMVDPRGADLDLHCDFHEQFCDSLFTTKEEAPGNVRDFLLRYGVSTNNKIKVEEFCIKPKNALFLLGTLDENPGLQLTPQPIEDPEFVSFSAGRALSVSFGGALSFLEAGHGSAVTEEVPLGEQLVGGHSLRELGFDKSDLYRTGYSRSAHAASGQAVPGSSVPATAKEADRTQPQNIAAALAKAGISNPAAWAAAGVTPAAIAVHSEGSATAPGRALAGSAPACTEPAYTEQGPQQSAASIGDFDPNPPVVLMKGRNNPTFLISWRSQRDLARSLGWKCALMIWGGPILFLLSLYGLQTLTHWF